MALREQTTLLAQGKGRGGEGGRQGLSQVHPFGGKEPKHSLAADGALALIRTVSLFSDVLSYLRLFALGYAGGALAGAFNDLASRIEQAQPGIGILAAALVLAIGHGLNLGLSVASAVVHGLRLNLIEFLNWSVAGEGRPFQHFERKENRAWRIRSA